LISPSEKLGTGISLSAGAGSIMIEVRSGEQSRRISDHIRARWPTALTPQT
jgi:hypothetical protein